MTVCSIDLTQLRKIGVGALQGCADLVAQRELFAEQQAWQQQRLAHRQQRKQEILAQVRIDTNNVPEWVTFNKMW